MSTTKTTNHKCEKCLKSYSTKQRLISHACEDAFINTFVKRVTKKNQVLLLFDEIIKLAQQFDVVNEITNTLNKINNSNIIIQNSNNNTINSNNTINNTIINNININIIYNIGDNLDIKALTDKKLYVDYYKNTRENFVAIQDSLNVKNALLKNNIISRSEKEEIKKMDNIIKISTGKILFHLTNKLSELYEILFFSANRPEYHMIYIPTNNLNNTFYIHVNNKWHNIGNIDFLANFTHKVFEYFTTGCEKYNFGTLGNITNYIYQQNMDQILNIMGKRFFIIGYENVEIVSKTFELTKNMVYLSIEHDNSDDIKDTLEPFTDVSVKHVLKEDTSNTKIQKSKIKSNVNNVDNNVNNVDNSVNHVDNSVVNNADNSVVNNAYANEDKPSKGKSTSEVVMILTRRKEYFRQMDLLDELKKLDNISPWDYYDARSKSDEELDIEIAKEYDILEEKDDDFFGFNDVEFPGSNK